MLQTRTRRRSKRVDECSGIFDGERERNEPRKFDTTAPHSLHHRARAAGSYRTTRPDPDPFISFSTSSRVLKLKSPLIECFKQLAATAYLMAV